VKLHTLFFILTVIIFTGCEQNDVSKARLMTNVNKKQSAEVSEQRAKEDNQTIVLQKMVGENQIALAKIEADKVQALKTMEIEQSKLKAQEEAKLQEKKLILEKELESMKLAQQKELAYLEEKRLVSNLDNENTFNQTILIIITLVVLLILLLVLWIHRKNKAHEEKMHEESLRHEEYMQASQQHHEKITKILEIVVDDKTDKNVKQELIELLKEQGGPALLLEDKKS